MRVQCSVCQELFCDSDFVMAPRCGHMCHKTCIRQWASTKGTCPTCRQPTSAKELIRIFLDFDLSDEVEREELQKKLEDMTEACNSQEKLKQKAREKLIKCRRELKKTQKRLEQLSSLAEKENERYNAEKVIIKVRLEALAESLSSPSRNPRNSQRI